jgi:predicted GIY-YIG superfamily endonuclease
MFYVYLIQSVALSEQRYTGFTTNLKERLKTHNAGKSIHTSKYRPWNLITYHAFSDKRMAQEFEHYLKTGSGKAFANKHLWPTTKHLS